MRIESKGPTPTLMLFFSGFWLIFFIPPTLKLFFHFIVSFILFTVGRGATFPLTSWVYWIINFLIGAVSVFLGGKVFFRALKDFKTPLSKIEGVVSKKRRISILKILLTQYLIVSNQKFGVSSNIYKAVNENDKIMVYYTPHLRFVRYVDIQEKSKI